MRKKEGGKKMKIRTINKSFRELEIINEWSQSPFDTDPLITSWRKKIREETISK